MKLSLSLTAICATAFAAAGFAQSGGFTGPDDLRLVTAAEAAELPDDTQVKMQGFIVRSLGDEKYEFKDDSGTLTVEIDDDDWRGLEVTPEDQVELWGEIEQERSGTELEAEAIRRVGPA